MYLKTLKCYQTFLNLTKPNVLILFIGFLLFFCNACSSNLQKEQVNFKEIFTKEFLSNKRVHKVLKEHVQKNDIAILDSDNLITNKPIDYSDDGIKLSIYNNLKEADLYVKYYIINSDLAYVVFFKNTNEGISFIFVKNKSQNKWSLFDSTIRNTR